MNFDGKCPFCGSFNCDVENSTQPAWGNNDEAIMNEDWTCNDCRKAFSTHAKIQVVDRELTVNLTCPYCGEDSLESRDMPIKFANMDDFHAFYCIDCERWLAVLKENWYKELTE